MLIKRPMGAKLNRKRLRQKWLQFVYQEKLCCWCKLEMNWWPLEGQSGRPGPMDATWEHLVPQAHGGSDSRWNMLVAHELCNRKRGTKPAEPHFAPFPKHWRGQVRHDR